MKHDRQPPVSELAQSISMLEAEIARQEETIRSLRSRGHQCTDAERQLNNLKESLALFK
jgi:prefoldin subunit 5